MRHERIELWDAESAPKDDGPVPSLTTYVLDGERKRPAVVICPGGGYALLSPREAEPIALRYAAAGFHAFVVEYSVAPRRHPQPLFDLARAVCCIREHESDWRVGPIAVCGFSAGGHAAANLGVHWNHAMLSSCPAIVRGRCRPNALILCYPVISSGPFAHRGSFAHLLGDHPPENLLKLLSLELRVTKETPPTFLWHTAADRSVPVSNSLLFAEALSAADVPFALHVFPNGPHGISLANVETSTPTIPPHPDVAVWHQLSVTWMCDLFAYTP
jgi:acetyl esterase/lipase